MPGEPLRMPQTNDPSSTPKDATKATDDQREIQDKLDHQHDDPDAPGRHQTKDQVADET
ncbi:hypothetical protein MGALJ_02290 [Mycobacterium gallinarum]|uniref:Uncharacterized protein n=2 Tax=Mycobacteriaceae TaxID=1762 RepID=A0A9W4B3Z9_9MYCO|nr:hypothetical protein [Mycobacterium sp. 29Ha]BBY90560.1 hypothetical protein MGALJ_02290 [Mycobacterium gallinarum]